MSKFLYILGRKGYDKPWYFIVGWIVILLLVLGLLGLNGVHISSNMQIQGTRAQQVADLLQKEVPSLAGGQGSVVFTVPRGERLDTGPRIAAIMRAVKKVYQEQDVVKPPQPQTPVQRPSARGGAAAAQAAEAAALQARLPYGPLVVQGHPVPGVIISRNGRVALFQFGFTVSQSSVPQSVNNAVIRDVTAVQHGTGIRALPGSTLEQNVTEGPTEMIGLVVAAVVLLATLGSLVAAGLPLLIAIMGVGIGVGGAFAFSKFFTVIDITPALALMIGLSVGIDYSLFIVNRQRRLILEQNLSARDAASRAVGTAGSAVFFSGLTVVIALCSMLVIGIQFLSVMALVAAATVAVNVLLALSLLPALLGLVGEKICTLKARRQSAAADRHGAAHRWATGIITHRWLVILGVVVCLGTAAIPMAQMNLGFPSGATANFNTPARQSYDATSQAFGAGFNGPLVIVLEPHRGKVTPQLLGHVVQSLSTTPDVSLVSPTGESENGRLAVLTVIPQTGPDAQATKNLVRTLRAPRFHIAATYGVTLGVTGYTALNIDMSAKLAQVFPVFMGIIVILSFIILMAVFRSLLVPLIATGGFMLSILATFGMTTAVFQWGWLHALFGFDTGGPLLSFLPIMVTGILYGLAMDYQVFLVSSMREAHVHGHRGPDSIVHGFDHASRVVIAAAIIMTSVFSGFIFSPQMDIKQIGFGLAFGVLVDAFIVRSTLVPAVMALFGDSAWWIPAWLDRILPNLDVEGDRLQSELLATE